MSCENSVEVPVCGITLNLDANNIGSGISEERVQEIVNETVANIPAGDGISYSLEEQWTGKYWVDGKKIYQKTIKIPGKLPTTQTAYKHGIANINAIMDQKAFASGVPSSSPECRFIKIPYVTNNIQTGRPGGVYLAVTETEIQMMIASSSMTYYTNAYVTLQYTCTDR